MEAREKAIELYNKFRNENAIGLFAIMSANARAKKEALICIEQIIENCPFKDYGFQFDTIQSRLEAAKKYWEEVKKELKALK